MTTKRSEADEALRRQHENYYNQQGLTLDGELEVGANDGKLISAPRTKPADTLEALLNGVNLEIQYVVMSADWQASEERQKQRQVYEAALVELKADIESNNYSPAAIQERFVKLRKEFA